MPELDPAVPPHEWHLGAEGRAAARELAAHLDATHLVTSPEPKARETAEEIASVCGATVTVDTRLCEARRPAVWDQDYRARAARYLAGEREPGWEAHEAVVARVRDAVVGAEVVVTHGLAMTLFLGEGVEFWEKLRFPDAWRTGEPESPGSAFARHLRRVH